MITKKELIQKNLLLTLALGSAVIILLFGVSCSETQKESNSVVAVELVKMNVLYLGVQNPVKIAASGYKPSELTVTIDNGTITGTDGEYNISPKEVGKALLTVSFKEKEIQKTEFRVKLVPDPVAAVKVNTEKGTEYISSGYISKKDLLSSEGLSVELRNFDFDLKFEVVSFVLSVNIPGGFTYSEKSESYLFTEKQIEQINRKTVDQKIYIEDVIAKGPDGAKRKLNSLLLTLSGE